MTQDSGRPPFKDFDARIERARRRDGAAGEAGDERPPLLNWGAGLQVGVELVAGVAGGSILGYGLDWWLGTAPFGLIVLFMLGAAAGMLNAWRHLKRMQVEGGG